MISGDELAKAADELAKAAEDRARLRLYMVSPRVLMELFIGAKDGLFYRPAPEGLPEDARVLEVHYDYESCRFAIKVQSREFAVVSDGGLIPKYPAPRLEFRQVDPELLKPTSERKPLF